MSPTCENGDEIFPAMLEGIRSAKKTITFETYIYWSGKVGKQFADALSERAQAGVNVNVTIDWAGSVSMDENLLKQMKDAGVHVERYRPLHWYNLGRMNNRTHRKLLVIDGRVGFTGGVGIGDPWQGHAQDPDHWRDMHFRIEGPAVAQMQAAFNDNWIKTSGRVLNGADFFPPLEKAGDMDAQHVHELAGERQREHAPDVPDDAGRGRAFDRPVGGVLHSGRTDHERAASPRAIAGVKIRILMPGKNTDSDAARMASKADWGPLLLAGVEMYEYEPTMFHNKMLIVDHEMVSVGSTNFDLRSFQLNDEASLNVYDAGFAEPHDRGVRSRTSRAARQYTYETWKNRPFKEKFAERFILPLKSQL